MYKYFVSYSYNGGFGMAEVGRSNPIRTFEDVLSIRKQLSEENGYNVIIISWQQLESNID